MDVFNLIMITSKLKHIEHLDISKELMVLHMITINGLIIFIPRNTKFISEENHLNRITKFTMGRTTNFKQPKTLTLI